MKIYLLKKYIEKNLTFATTYLHTHSIKDIVHFFQYVQCTSCRLIAHWRLIKLLSTETTTMMTELMYGFIQAHIIDLLFVVKI